jgi:toxin FitB
LTLGEIRRGIEALEATSRRQKLQVWLVRRPDSGGDAAVADRWGRLLAEVKRPVPAIDGLLAATALHHGLRLVTRNAADFEYPSLEVVNRWAS